MAPHAVILPREGWAGPQYTHTPATPLVVQYVELGGAEFVYMDCSVHHGFDHWVPEHLFAPDTHMVIDPMHLPALAGELLVWANVWDIAARTLRVALGRLWLVWPRSAIVEALGLVAQVQQPAGINNDCSVWHPPLLASARQPLVGRGGEVGGCCGPRWVHGVCRAPAFAGGAFGSNACLSSGAEPPQPVANIWHQVGLPDPRLHMALTFIAVVTGGMSLLTAVSLHHVEEVLRRQRQYAPHAWERSAQQWLTLEENQGTHAAGQSDVGCLVVMVFAEVLLYAQVMMACVEWVKVTTTTLKWRRSTGHARYSVLGTICTSPARKVQRCKAVTLPPAAKVSGGVTAEPQVLGLDVWPIAPENTWHPDANEYYKRDAGRPAGYKEGEG